MTTSLWISTIAMFGVLVISSFGRKPFNWIRALLPVAILGYFAATYLKDVPTGGNNGLLLAASIILGALIGLVLVLLSRAEYDQTNGKTYVYTNPASIAILAFVFIFRIVLIEFVTHHGKEAYRFSMQHHFDLEVLGPIFILMAGAMIIVRVAGIFAKVNRNPSNVSKMDS
ncbi:MULTISPECIES: CcdC protein domain-containing protein [Paenibacillus]|uniref:DUF1453 family protein n=1 Tax=Paenibacillus albilobatus TaxID=2716884 RepID=A0A919XH51_9BACL|nr:MULTISPECIES: CcdC protein domain-containing protein [Paenibacillus]GIO32539.1 hypothetical protein J2TS6_36800 [Paenibacillus albilobatus]